MCILIWECCQLQLYDYSKGVVEHFLALLTIKYCFCCLKCGSFCSCYVLCREFLLCPANLLLQTGCCCKNEVEWKCYWLTTGVVVVYSEGVCHGDELFIMFKPRALPVDSSRNPEDRKVRKSSPVISGLKSWILRPGGHCIGLNMRGGYFMGLNHIANTVHKFEAEGWDYHAHICRLDIREINFCWIM